MERETMERLASEYIAANGPDGLAGFLAKAIDDDNKIVREYEWWAKEEMRIIEQHEQERDAHKRKLRELQKRCPHRDERYYPDAAGGSDSCTVCQSCHRQT